MNRFVPHETEMELYDEAESASEAAFSWESSSDMVEMVGDCRISSDRDWIAAIGSARLCIHHEVSALVREVLHAPALTLSDESRLE